MKRNTDVWRLPPAATQEAAGTSARSSRCAQAVERLTTLLDSTMRDSELPTAALSHALTRMAQTLSDMGAPLYGSANRAPDDLRGLRDAFARDIAVCIENLQFHDRLIQQLTHVRDILNGLGANRLPSQVPATPGREGSIELF